MIYRYKKTPLHGKISDYEEELRLHKVDETKWEFYWNRLMKKYHYLGYEGVIGGRVKYIITLGTQIVGAISFCSAVYRLGSRDAYIGWDDDTRVAMLQHLVNNNRFLILPEIKIHNLASRVLSMSLQRLREDWERQYEVVPYMVETFVDERFHGTCYKASNWTYLGSTKGYGKKGQDFVYHGQKRSVYVYIMDRPFAKRFKPDLNRVKDERVRLEAMLNGTPMWYPSLLKEIGVTDNPVQKITQRFVDHLTRYTPYVGRSENKRHFTAMEQGLLSDLKRKSIEPIAIAFEGSDNVRNLTNFMSRSKWDDEGMLGEYRQESSEFLTHEEGMITGDNTSVQKKGSHSVGVARQYCGNTGKIDNCQTGVMVGYASAKGYGIIDYGLYMPKKWFDVSHADLRNKCGVPSEVCFQTKNDMMLEMIREANSSGLFPAKYVGVDSEFGSDSDFLDGLPDGLIYFADVRSNQHVFADRPGVFTPAYSGKGRKPTREKADFSPLDVKTLVEHSEEPWERVVLGIGAKGPVIAQDKCLRVVEVRGGLPGKDVWLYARKMDDGAIKYALCNAPGNAQKNEIRKPALMRWSIEQCFKECKDYLGMDHYESRSWDAWHRHILLTLIAHLFIIKLRIEFSCKPKSPNATPHVTNPVSLEDYLNAHLQMLADEEIEHPDISAMPIASQQFLTIGLIQKLVSAVFPRVGTVVQEVDYLLSKAASSFASHSSAAVKNAFQRSVAEGVRSS